MVRTLVGAAALASLAAGCAAPVTAPVEADRSRDAIAVQPAGRPVIAKLRLRDVDLTIESSSRGPLFAVAARDGSFSERDLGADDLAARYPMLYQFYRSAVARSPEGPYLDARLDTPLRGDRAGGPRSR
jgi:hypothetical protein